MSAATCSECGASVLTYPRVGKHRSKQAKAGQPYRIKGHDLCQHCMANATLRSSAKTNRLIRKMFARKPKA